MASPAKPQHRHGRTHSAANISYTAGPGASAVDRSTSSSGGASSRPSHRSGISNAEAIAHELHDASSEAIGGAGAGASAGGAGHATNASSGGATHTTAHHASGGITDSQRELLAFYRHKIENFEREREDYMKRLQWMECNKEEHYRIKLDISRRDDHIAELQKALSDAHVYLYDEREQVLKLTALNDQLKIREVEDRRRIQHLLALTQPVSQEVTYFKERRPDVLTTPYPPNPVKVGGGGTLPGASGASASYYGAASASSSTSGGKPSGSGGSEAKQNVQERRGSPKRVVLGNDENKLLFALPEGPIPLASSNGKRLHGNGGGNGKGANILRTIYLPNETADTLKLMIQSLRTQLEEQHTLNEQRTQALLEDRLIREAEMKERDAKYRAEIATLRNDLKEMTESQLVTTKDYLDLRHKSQGNERQLKEESSRLTDENRRIYQVMQKVTSDAKSESRSTRAKITEESERYIDQFRIQTINSEEDRAIMKAQYEATQQLYEKRLNYLEGRIIALNNKCRALEKRRNLELEGFTNDFKILRAQLRGMEKLLVDLKLASLAADSEYNNSGGGSGSGVAPPNGVNVYAGSSVHARAGSASTAPLSLHARCLLAQQHFDRFKVELGKIANKLALT